MSRKVFRSCIFSVLILLSAFTITILFAKMEYVTTEETVLNKLVRDLTLSYRTKQIIGTMVMFFGGLIVSIPFCRSIGWKYALFLAMPMGNALWGVVSEVFLFTGIPYTSVVMLVTMIGILTAIVIVFRKEYSYIDVGDLILTLTVVLAISVMASAGVFALFKSSDSYYYVMQYGELITQNKILSTNIVGNFLTWTGISSALTSSYAAMWGCENIYAIHYLLIFSMYGFITYSIYRKASRSCARKTAVFCSGLTLVTVAAIPAVSFLSIWLISNTYFMVYIVFIMMLPIIAGEKVDTKLMCVISIFSIWLMLSRLEAAPVICFLIICISYLNLPRKQILVLFISTCSFELLYLSKVFYENLCGGRQASQQDLTIGTAAIMLLAFAFTGLYLCCYNLGLVKFVRRHMSTLGLIGLMLGCVVLGALDWERLVNNIQVITENMGSWFWAYVPGSVVIIEIVKSFYRGRDKYFDLTVFGFILINFAICMGRTHYLRVGIGDSYNRICMSIVPLYVVSTVHTFLNKYEKRETVKLEPNEEKNGYEK